MSGFDADRVYSVAVHDAPDPVAPEKPSETEKLFLEFLLQYRVGGEFIYRQVWMSSSCIPRSLYYRDKLRANLLLKQHQLEVDLRHIGLFNDELAHAIQERPAEILPLVGHISPSPSRRYTLLIVSQSSKPRQQRRRE